MPVLISSVSRAPALTVPETAGGLPAALSDLRDPRSRRGVRHHLTVVVTAAVCAVVAGYRSYAAIAEWVADAPETTVLALGMATDRRPSEAMIRRLLQAMDPQPLTAAIGVWLAGRATAGTSPTRRAIAVGGKTLRGSRPTATTARHVLAACDQVLTIASGIDFPHAAQAVQIRRRRHRFDQPKRFITETVYAITDLRVHQADQRNWPPGSAGTGTSRTNSTGSATSPTTKTAARSAPAPDPRSWPPYATSRSTRYAPPESPTSLPAPAITPATATARWHSSASPDDFAGALEGWLRGDSASMPEVLVLTGSWAAP